MHLISLLSLSALQWGQGARPCFCKHSLQMTFLQLSCCSEFLAVPLHTMHLASARLGHESIVHLCSLTLSAVPSQLHPQFTKEHFTGKSRIATLPVDRMKQRTIRIVYLTYHTFSIRKKVSFSLAMRTWLLFPTLVQAFSAEQLSTSFMLKWVFSQPQTYNTLQVIWFMLAEVKLSVEPAK